ncbi:leucine-rich repeat-containing protein 63 [Myripristis murdjan]|uniref:leucine-rich repeat-containing protein 63 n=1 Tax=Myripristis murdjan TaxID=586833 RepID=UPI001175D2BC|nr:leucine-rich repeat-containing protein 63 [Myripristis murdjan]
MSSDHVRLLRRPLPPKKLPPVLTPRPAARPPDSRGSSLQEADLHTPRRAAPTPVMADTSALTTDSMSMGFPWRKPHILPKNPLLQILHTDPRFVPPPPSFCLCDFLQTRHEVGRGSQFLPGLGRTAVSRCNYRKMVNLLLQDLHRSRQTEVSRQLLTSQDLWEVSSRVPHGQLLCELAVLINMEVTALQVTMRSSLLDPEPQHQLPYQPDTQWPDLKASPSTGREAVLNSVTAKHSQGSPHTPLPFRPITESISPSERAVLYCLKQGGKALNLKFHDCSYFIQVLWKGFHSAQTLVCLNLSFNNLSVFPEELYDLVQLAELNMKENPLQQLPAGLQRLVRLRTLVLSSCRIRCLPAE